MTMTSEMFENKEVLAYQVYSKASTAHQLFKIFVKTKLNSLKFVTHARPDHLQYCVWLLYFHPKQKSKKK